MRVGLGSLIREKMIRLLVLIMIMGVMCFLSPGASAHTSCRLMEESMDGIRYIYQYGSNGQLLQKTQYSCGEEQWIDEYYYDADKVMIEKRGTDKSGFVLDFHYDSNQTQIEFENDGLGGELWWYKEAPPYEQKDPKGRTVYIRRYSSRSADNIDDEFYYVYDDQGRIQVFETSWRRDVFTYYGDGSYIRTSTDLKSNESYITERYDTSGSLIEKIDGYGTRWRYVYDNRGLLVERYKQSSNEETETHYCSYKYRFDDNGNVIFKTQVDEYGEYTIKYRYETVDEK